jgi:photosystem II stability/assembly factor-like uncharacterized protein
MGTRKWGEFTRILTVLVMLCLALGGALVPGTAYAQGTWNVMTHPTTSGLYGVWGSSPGDVFAVGDAGTILHYDGTWSTMSPLSATLLNVWGSSDNDVFAVGMLGAILHYDGTWSAMSSLTTNNLWSVWGSSASDVFAVGEGGTILHYEGSGSTWSTMPNIPTTNELHSVWGSGPDDVFAVGGGGTILHYDGNGSTWSAMPNIPTTDTLHSVWGSSATDVFAVGNGGTILHYDGNGSTWSTMPNIPTSNELHSVWGSSASDVFAVGWPDAILHYSGGGGSSGTVTCNVTPQIISLTVADGSVDYGNVALGGTRTTLDLQPVDSQTITNTGNLAEKIEVNCSDATGGVTWTLVPSSSIGLDQFAHQWSTDSGTNWNDLGYDYATLKDSLDPSGTQPFDLKLWMPTSTSDTLSKSIIVTVMATVP